MYFFSPMLYFFFNFSLYIGKNNFILGKNFKSFFLNLEVSLFFQSSSFHFEAISMSLSFWVFFWLYYEWLLLLLLFYYVFIVAKKNKWTPCVCARRNAKAIKCMLVKLMMFGVFIHCLLSKLHIVIMFLSMCRGCSRTSAATKTCSTLLWTTQALPVLFANIEEITKYYGSEYDAF